MYLMSRGKWLITVDEIRASLGLETRALDGVIEAGLISACSISRGMLRDEQWAIPDNADFLKTANSVGSPTSISAPLKILKDPRDHRVVTYRANDKDLAVTREVIRRWCLRQNDICDALEAEADAAHVSVADLAAFWNAGPTGRALALQAAERSRR